MRKENMKKSMIMAGVFFVATVGSWASRIEVQVDKPGHKIAPALWGVFFEDINLSADGGIYPELVRNGSFEDGAKPEFWKFTNAADAHCESAIDSTRPLNSVNPHCLRVNIDGAFTLSNDGYWGMNIVR